LGGIFGLGLRGDSRADKEKGNNREHKKRVPEEVLGFLSGSPQAFP
jgi:hypothetical protein